MPLAYFWGVVIVENGVRLRLNIVDTPGYGDQVNNENWYVAWLTICPGPFVELVLQLGSYCEVYQGGKWFFLLCGLHECSNPGCFLS